MLSVLTSPHPPPTKLKIKNFSLFSKGPWIGARHRRQSVPFSLKPCIIYPTPLNPLITPDTLPNETLRVIFSRASAAGTSQSQAQGVRRRGYIYRLRLSAASAKYSEENVFPFVVIEMGKLCSSMPHPPPHPGFLYLTLISIYVHSVSYDILQQLQLQLLPQLSRGGTRLWSLPRSPRPQRFLRSSRHRRQVA